jgi:drug/metabolite transporter (DMT)-like permease
VRFYDWMLALHLLAAFAVGAALVLYSVLVYSGRRMTSLEQTRILFRLAPYGTPLIAGGTVLVLILGVILAIDHEEYQLWDLWVLIGIVLWAVLGAVGQRSGAYYTAVQEVAERGGPDAEREVFARLRAPTGARLHLVTVVVFVLLVLDMIFKPWA